MKWRGVHRGYAMEFIGVCFEGDKAALQVGQTVTDIGLDVFDFVSSNELTGVVPISPSFAGFIKPGHGDALHLTIGERRHAPGPFIRHDPCVAHPLGQPVSIGEAPQPVRRDANRFWLRRFGYFLPAVA